MDRSGMGACLERSAMMARLLRVRPATTIVLAVLAIAAGLVLGVFDTVREAGAEPVCNYSFNPGTNSGKGRTNPWDGDQTPPTGASSTPTSGRIAGGGDTTRTRDPATRPGTR